MKVTVIGTGYVGLVTGTCLADLGNEVMCFDINQDKVAQLNAGQSPIYESGLDSLLNKNRLAGRLHFSCDIEASIHHGEILFIAVGTPPGESGQADISQVLEVARNIGLWMRTDKVVVNKSTVPVGTADAVQSVIERELAKRGWYKPVGELQLEARPEFCVISNPEFLKEGSAVEDFMRPDRIILGIPQSPQGLRARDLMRQLYAPFNRHHERTLIMSVRSSEFTKYASNAMLATRISFMNELANLAEKIGVDIESVRQGMGSDPRIGYSFLYAGTGYGGSCFPKDIKALQQTAQSNDMHLHVLNAVESVNELQKHLLVKKVLTRFGENIVGKVFAIWGLAFKPNTDDMREAPSLVIMKELIQLGATVQVFDPVATDAAKFEVKREWSNEPEALNKVVFMDHEYKTLSGADALLIVTEWKAFRSPDFALIKSELRTPAIFDGRNLFEPEDLVDLGIEYHGVGRLNQLAFDAINR
jgi:UDPglucose 6-dehydrogenase